MAELARRPVLQRGLDRLQGTGAPIVAAGLLIAGAGVLAIVRSRSDLLGLVACIVLLAAAVCWSRPERMAVVVLVAAFATTPTLVRPAVTAGGIQVFLFEPALLFLVVAIAVRSDAPRITTFDAFYLIGCALGVGLGIAARADVTLLIREAKPLLDLWCTAWATRWFVGRPETRLLIRAVVAVLWVSAAEILLASLHLLDIYGREEAAGIGTDRTAALRLLGFTSVPALVLLLVVLVLLLQGRLPGTTALAMVPPLLLIVFVSFSRNAIVAIAVACLAAVVVTALRGASRALLAVLARAGAALLLLGATIGLVSILLPASGYLGLQVSAFLDRVVGGLALSNLTSDPSLTARAFETRHLVADIAHSPLIGYGFGYDYQPQSGYPGGFGSTLGTSYAHDFYLWVWVKAGLVGAIAICSWLVWAAQRGLRSAGPTAFAAGAALVGVLSILVVTPMPIDVPGCAALGALAGVALAGHRSGA